MILEARSPAGLWLKVLVADVRDLSRDLQECQNVALLESAGICDVAVFSPPYKQADGYSLELMEATGDLLEHLLVRGAWAFMNFAQLREEFMRPFHAQAAMTSRGLLTSHQRITWVKSYSPGPGQPCKGHVQPLNSNSLLNYSFEDVFSSYVPTEAGKEPSWNRLEIGVPFADKSNLTRDSRGKNGDQRCGGDVWVIPYSTTGHTDKKAHPYEFPEELARRCLLLGNGEPGKVALDPFLGSGVTAIMAKQLDMHCLGVERDEQRARAALARWEAA